MNIRIAITVLLAGVLALTASAAADIKVLEADSLYTMGDNDSRVDARRIATQEAKRKALEMAGTFVASLTQVREYRLTKDEVTAYTAGVVETDIVADEARGTLQNPAVYIKVRCRIDTEVMVSQIDRYRENQELREQLEATAKDKAALQKERDELVRQLASEKDKSQAGETQRKLGAVLDREEDIDATNRVWSRVVPKMDLYGSDADLKASPADLEKATTALERAVERNPRNQQGRLLLATVYEQRKDLVKAEQHLRAAVDRDPDNALLRLRLGIVLREQGKYADALKEFRVIEKKRPQQLSMLFQTGLTHKLDGNCRMASAYMKRFLLYSKKVDKPAVNRLKPKAKEIFDECGDYPPPKKKRRQ